MHLHVCGYNKSEEKKHVGEAEMRKRYVVEVATPFKGLVGLAQAASPQYWSPHWLLVAMDPCISIRSNQAS